MLYCEDTGLKRRKRRKGLIRGSRSICREARQGASGKRANSDFPSRGWKILIGWLNSGSAEYGRIWLTWQRITDIANIADLADLADVGHCGYQTLVS